jgi:hypothetical protein
MMRNGMLIDLDHMSQLTFEAALKIGDKYSYPPFSGHSNIRLNGGSERDPTHDHYLTIGNHNGMTGVASAGLDACTWTMQATKILQAMDYPMTVSADGNHLTPTCQNATCEPLNAAGISFGTDTDGMAMGMPPDISYNTPSAGKPATMVTDYLQHVFYRDVNGSIRHVYWDDQDHSGLGIPKSLNKDFPWAGPQSPNNAPSASGDPSALNFSQQQHMFYRDTQNQVQHVTEDSLDGRGRLKFGVPGISRPVVRSQKPLMRKCCSLGMIG